MLNKIKIVCEIQIFIQIMCAYIYHFVSELTLFVLLDFAKSQKNINPYQQSHPQRLLVNYEIVFLIRTHHLNFEIFNFNSVLNWHQTFE